MSTYELADLVRRATPEHRPTTVIARVANTLTRPEDDLWVTVGAFDGHRTRWGPVTWAPHPMTENTVLPTRGDDVLLIFDENEAPWVITIRPSTVDKPYVDQLRWSWVPFTGIAPTCLVHMDGYDGATTFPDSAPPPFGQPQRMWTPYGNAHVDRTASRWGTAALRLDGAGDYIQTPDAPELRFGSGNFMIDCWLALGAYPTSGIATIFSKRANSSQFAGGAIYITPAGKVGFVATFDGATWGVSVTGATTLALAAWHHVAVVRNNNDWRLWVNGVSDGFVNVAGSLGDNSSPVRIGGDTDDFGFVGVIDEFRINNAEAWKAGPRIPPPFTDHGNVTLGGQTGIGTSMTTLLSTPTLPAGTYHVVASALLDSNNTAAGQETWVSLNLQSTVAGQVQTEAPSSVSNGSSTYPNQVTLQTVGGGGVWVLQAYAGVAGRAVALRAGRYSGNEVMTSISWARVG